MKAYYSGKSKIVKGMRFIFCCTVCCFFLLVDSFSQKHGSQFTIYSTIGLKAGGGYSYLSNGTIRKDEMVNSKPSSLTYSYGGKFAVSYMGAKPKYTIISIHGELLRRSFNADYKDIVYNSAGDNYNKNIKFRENELLLFLRYTRANKRLFIDAGMQIGSFHKVKEDNSITANDFYSSSDKGSVIDNYQSFSSIVIGLGTYFKKFVVGLRYTGSVTGIAKGEAHPLYDGVYNNSTNNPDYTGAYNSVLPTNTGSIQLTIEYYIPFFAFGRASCGGKGYSFFKGVDNTYYWGKKGNWYD